MRLAEGLLCSSDAQSTVQLMAIMMLTERKSASAQVPAPPPKVLVRVTASVPRVGLSVQLGARPGADGLGCLEVVLADVAFSLAEDNEVLLNREGAQIWLLPSSLMLHFAEDTKQLSELVFLIICICRGCLLARFCLTVCSNP